MSAITIAADDLRTLRAIEEWYVRAENSRKARDWLGAGMCLQQLHSLVHELEDSALCIEHLNVLERARADYFAAQNDALGGVS